MAVAGSVHLWGLGVSQARTSHAWGKKLGSLGGLQSKTQGKVTLKAGLRLPQAKAEILCTALQFSITFLPL